MIYILVLGVLEGEEKRAGTKRFLRVGGSGCDCKRATRGIPVVRDMFYPCQCPGCVGAFAGCSLRRKQGKVYLRSLCITSYNCIWIYNDLKIKHCIFFKKGEKLLFQWKHNLRKTPLISLLPSAGYLRYIIRNKFGLDLGFSFDFCLCLLILFTSC